MRASFFLFLFLGSCSLPFTGMEDLSFASSVSPRKQKQKIVALQKKLEGAIEVQEKALKEVERLQRECDQAQIAFIARQVDELEKEMYQYRETPDLFLRKLPYDASSLFLAERETLYQLIQGGPSPSAFEAQVVLDQILRVITTIRDY